MTRILILVTFALLQEGGSVKGIFIHSKFTTPIYDKCEKVVECDTESNHDFCFNWRS